MPEVELIYDTDCPNVVDAREQLRRALAALGLPPVWREWDRRGKTSPAYALRYGSPTILVDGRDVAGTSPSGGADCCRLYRDRAGRSQGVPPVEAIIAAMKAVGR